MRIIQLVENWLASEGYKHEIDSDGDVKFRYEGHTFWFCPGKDETFFRIIMPNIYTVEGNREKVLEAANKVTRDVKVLKAFLVEDNLWLAIEMFIDSSPEVEDFMERCLDILVEGFKMSAREILGQ